MGKKNLEQLFKDTFRDFGEVPDERVWQAIEASLDNTKKRKRLLPIWWRLGGAAAAVALLLYFLSPFGPKAAGEVDPIFEATPVITDVQEHRQPDTLKGQQEGQPDDRNGEPAADSLHGDPSDREPHARAAAPRTAEGEGIADRGEGPRELSGEAHGRTREDQAKADREDSASLAQLADNQTRDSLGQVSQPLNPNRDPSTPREALAQQDDKNTDDRTGLGQQAKDRTDGLALQDPKKEGEGKSIYEAIREMEEEAVAETGTSGKWSLGPSVAPVYFGSSGQGSPINPEFSSNAKSGQVNLSYGLSVAYEVGRKVRIRTGVHRVNYGYDTKEVAFSTSMRMASARRFDNIDYNGNAQNIVVESKSIRYTNDFLESPSGLASKEVVMNEVPVLDGKMVQELGYIEVPLEVNYALVDKKFGLELIGGLSSLFLVDNAVLLESQDLVTEMGEANNVNSLNFSANVGMGLNYKFSPKVRLNLEPIFKYQLNTFSNTAGNFHPFSVGVYSGVSFRF